jgi:hypothetical protein
MVMSLRRQHEAKQMKTEEGLVREHKQDSNLKEGVCFAIVSDRITGGSRNEEC